MGSPLPTTRTLVKRALIKLSRKLPSLYAALIFGLSGAAFAIGSLLLARVMPVAEFGSLSLALAIFNVFCLLAPIGMDQLILRHPIRAGPRLLTYLLISGTVAGSAVGLAVSYFGFLESTDALMLAIAICAGGIVVTASSGLRAQNQIGSALLIVTAGSWTLLALGVFSLTLPVLTLRTPLAVFSLGQVMMAAIGWISLTSIRHDGATFSIPWREAGSLLAIAAVGTISLQFERIIIAPLLGIEDVALFSVLASVSIFPFRMATSGVNFALMPRLKVTAGTVARRKLIRQELAAVSIALILASVAVVLLAPMVASWLTAGRYTLSTWLVAAACLNGSSKVVQAFPRAILTAYGTSRDLAYLGILGWIGLCISTVGGMLGTIWGLAGLVSGAAVGSLMFSIFSIVAAHRVIGDVSKQSSITH